MKAYTKPAWRSAAAYGYVRLCIELPTGKEDVEEKVASVVGAVRDWIEEGTLEEHIIFETDAEFTFAIAQGEETELDRFETSVPSTDTLHGSAEVDIFDYDAVEEAGIATFLSTRAN
jgi:hypothetical protein